MSSPRRSSSARRLARELHDETGQALTSILLGLRTVEEAGGDEQELHAAVAEVRELVRSTLQDVRQLAVELRPKVLDDFGLVAALERLTETFGEQTGMSVQFQQLLPTSDRLPPEVETALYRIVQESLTNIVKHARADEREHRPRPARAIRCPWSSRTTESGSSPVSPATAASVSWGCRSVSRCSGAAWR